MSSNSHSIRTDSVEATLELGRLLGRALAHHDWVGLAGQLGAGKTCLVKGLASGLGVDPKIVTSPTFTILQSYSGRLQLHHLDLYRIQTYDELIEIGYEDLLVDPGVCVVEWCQRIPESKPAAGLLVAISFVADSSRQLTIEAFGRRGRALLDQIV